MCELPFAHNRNGDAREQTAPAIAWTAADVKPSRGPAGPMIPVAPPSTNAEPPMMLVIPPVSCSAVIPKPSMRIKAAVSWPNRPVTP
jgi:hypothetical protein